ncbi:MAG: hypothetical protein H6766_07675 [Candidatus Peribacteria bacterium]|nr:MAG: hypothetical protein H6766_07675 [Candidatus Peribacteria bacterium]
MPCAVDYTAGQFMYVQYPRGGESHPFTVLSYDNERQVMRIAYKAQGKRTKSLARLSGTSGQYMYVDGPYGRFTSDIVTSDRPVVCIAAGIGITPFYELVEQYVGSRDMKLLYMNRTSDTTPYKHDFDEQLADDCIHILSREREQTQENEIIGTRLTPAIIREQVGDWLPCAQFYICGSSSVIASVCDMLASLGVQQSYIDYEPFDM